MKHCLVVDDSRVIRKVACRILAALAFETEEAADGESALQSCRRQMPDVILLDVAMPEMDGYEVCRRLKADAKLAAIPVIFISALSATRDKVKAFACGGVDYVTKPFQIEEVHARVETHHKLRQLQIQLERQNGEL